MPAEIGMIGTGGHAKVVADIFGRMDSHVRLIFFSASPTGEPYYSGYTVNDDSVDTLEKAAKQLTKWHVAIGSPLIRRTKTELLSRLHGELVSAFHDRSIISGHSAVGEGTSVMAGAVINPDAVVGKGCIINTSASVDHDCRVGSFVNIGPGCRLAGGVRIGDLTELGAGAVVIPRVSVGIGCVIGAGAVVISDIPDHSVAVGVPAKVIAKKDPC